MKEISLNILDITQNSISAGADRIELVIDDSKNNLIFSVIDNGCGMSKEMLESVTDPFTTTRTTRKVGLGIPLLKEAAEQTGGYLTIESELDKGTSLTASFVKDNIDCPPLGDMAGTIALLIQSISDDTEFIYRRIGEKGDYELSTSEIKEILGDDISLKQADVLLWIQDYVRENESEII